MPASPKFRSRFLAIVLAAVSPYAVFGHGAYHDVVAELNAKLSASQNDADLRFRLASAHAEHGEWQACLVEVARIEEMAPRKFHTTYLSGILIVPNRFGGLLAASREALDLENPAAVVAPPAP